MASPNRVVLALFDHLALLRHTFDDAVDRLLLILFERFNVGRVPKIGHGPSFYNATGLSNGGSQPGRRNGCAIDSAPVKYQRAGFIANAAFSLPNA